MLDTSSPLQPSSLLQTPAAGALGRTTKLVACSADKDRRRRRFALLNKAKALLSKDDPRHRLNICMRSPIRGRHVEVVCETGKGRVWGVQKCGLIWTCPVCSPSISQRRREELNTALAEARRRGLSIALVTLTMRHNAGEALRDTLGAMKDAKKAWRQHPDHRRAIPSIFGTITSTEITHGANGWHPHFHILVFVQPGIKAVPLLEGLRQAWHSALGRVGRDGNGAAYDVQDGSAAGRYIAKWGAAEEMTMSSSKDAKSDKGATPFQLLARYADGDKRAGALFVEYVRATKRRNALVWSQGLKAALAVDEVSDQQAAEDPAPPPEVGRVRLSRDEWQAVRERLSDLLDLADLGQVEAVRAFVDRMVGSRGGGAARRPGAEAPGRGHGPP